MRSLQLLAVLLGALAVGPVALGAAHLAAWHSNGVAVDSAGHAVAIDIHWHGNCAPYYTVETHDLVTNARLSHADFTGYEAQTDMTSPGNTELFNTQLGSTTPGITLSMKGYQYFLTDGSSMWQHFEGTYQQYAAVIASVKVPWVFCDA